MSIPTPSQNARVFKSGWLTKKGGSKGKWYEIASWKRRWFVISDEGVFYYKDKKEQLEGKPLGHLQFNNELSIRDVPDSKEKCLFAFYSSGRDPMQVKADVEQGKREWLATQPTLEMSRRMTSSMKVPGSSPTTKTTSTLEDVTEEQSETGEKPVGSYGAQLSANIMQNTDLDIGDVKGSWRDNEAFISRLSDGQAHFATDLCHMISVTRAQVQAGIEQIVAICLYLSKLIEIYVKAEKDVDTVNVWAQGELTETGKQDQMKSFGLLMGSSVKLFADLSRRRIDFCHQLKEQVVEPMDTWSLNANQSLQRCVNREAAMSKTLADTRNELLTLRRKCLKDYRALEDAHVAYVLPPISTEKDKTKQATLTKRTESELQKLKSVEEKCFEKCIKHFTKFDALKTDLLALQSEYVNETLPLVLHTMESLEEARLALVQSSLNILMDLEEKSNVAVDMASRLRVQVDASNSNQTIQECISQWRLMHGRPPKHVLPVLNLPCNLDVLTHPERFGELPAVVARIESAKQLAEEGKDGEGLHQDDDDDDEQVGGLLNMVRTLVSKKKKRFREEGFDLDLTYIKDNVIAMGFPAEGVAGQYRNNMVDVQRFLNLRHARRYRIYNLCSEIAYDHVKFEGRVARYGFPDHNPSPFDMIYLMVSDIYQWVQKHPKNIVAVHCKAGKGRTGFCIAAFLVYSHVCLAPDCQTATEALKYFGDKRTYDGEGVTIPSQKRFVYYFEWWLKYQIHLGLESLVYLVRNPSLLQFEEVYEKKQDDQEEHLYAPFQGRFNVQSLITTLLEMKSVSKCQSREQALQLISIMRHVGLIAPVDPVKHAKLADNEFVVCSFPVFNLEAAGAADDDAPPAEEGKDGDDADADDGGGQDKMTHWDLAPSLSSMLGTHDNWSSIRVGDLALPVIPDSNPLYLKSVVLHGIPFSVSTNDSLWFEIFKPLQDTCSFSTQSRAPMFRVAEDYVLWTGQNSKGMTKLNGDLRVQFYKAGLKKKEKMFHVWLNTRFLVPDSREPGLYKVIIPKIYIDTARKDRKAVIYPDHMTLEITCYSVTNRTRLELQHSKIVLDSHTHLPDITELVRMKETKHNNSSKPAAATTTTTSAAAAEEDEEEEETSTTTTTTTGLPGKDEDAMDDAWRGQSVSVVELSSEEEEEEEEDA